MKCTPKEFEELNWEYNDSYNYTEMEVLDRKMDVTPLVYKSNIINTYKFVFLWELIFSTKDKKTVLLNYSAQHEHLIQFDNNNDEEVLEKIIDQSYFKFCNHYDTKKEQTFFKENILTHIDFKDSAKILCLQYRQ